MSVSEKRYEWEEAGAFEVSEGVFRIPLPLPGDVLRAVNTYLIFGSDGVVLIDSGQSLEVSRGQFERSLASVGVGFGDIREFLVTHIHRDHYTQAIALRREFGMRVSLGDGERSSFDAIQARSHTASDRQFGMLKACGANELFKTVSEYGGEDSAIMDLYERPDGWLSDGISFGVGDRELRVVSTPGHTKGHVVFRDQANGLLFAGDHVLPHITPSIGLEADRPRLPLRDYLGSLRKVRTMPDSRLLPAHGPVVESTHKRIDELLDHHDVRLSETLGCLDSAGSTVLEVARQLRWTRHFRKLEELDVFNQMLAVFETKYHLDLLVEMGRATVMQDGEALQYRAVA